ncbi:MAG TPA: glycosyltransferase [Acidimicrobiales bacterium]|jgi:glycosyltransferase involved in cell wall biosynthesis|nr:glycosyltransferase [Acidimicrobiales bacterium]
MDQLTPRLPSVANHSTAGRALAPATRGASQRTRPVVALAHDYLTQRGGAERMMLSLLRAFPEAPLYTSVYEPESTYPEFGNYDVRTLWPNRIAALRQHHRRGLPIYQAAFSRLLIDAEALICSSSGFAHGARTTGVKIVYCHTPSRWLYQQADEYLAGWPRVLRAGARMLAPALRHTDRRQATTADLYLANSAVVRERIAEAYGIDALVVPPPMTSFAVGTDHPVAGVVPGYLLCVSRLLTYKKVDVVISAFAELPDHRLIVVGSGPEEERLRAACPRNVALLGHVDDAELRWLYRNCAAVVSAAHEDFGLTALEAASCGKPAVVLEGAGFLDTVIDGKTGVFFPQPTAGSIVAAVRKAAATTWDPEAITDHAESFSEASFAKRLHQAVATTLEGRRPVS